MRINNTFGTKDYLILSVMIFIVVSCKDPGKKIVGRFSDGTIGLVYYYPDKKDTLTFVSIEYYQNGKIRRCDTVQNRKVVGKPTVYYPDGKIYEIDSLANSPDIYTNAWDGIQTHYYENGNISEQFVVRNGQVNGLSKHYDINGKLIKEYYLKDTIKNGEYEDFYDNGKILFKATFLNGLPTGFEYFFAKNGDTTKYYAVNRKGELTLPYKRWLKNGDILIGQYLDTTKTIASWTWYNKDGKEVRRMVEHSANKTFVSPEPN